MSLNEFLTRLSANIFSHPYASDGKDKQGIFAPARKVSKKYALGMRTIQLNGPRLKRYLCFDIDRPHAGIAWDDANLPIPNLIITNPHNGHAHLVWELAEGVWEARKGDERPGRALPLRYMKAVYTAMQIALGADPSYNGLLVKNPFHPDWTVTCGRSTPYTLGELATHLDLDSAPSRAKLVDTGYRNCSLFDSLRIWAYRNKRYHSSLASFRDATDDEINYLNSRLATPLGRCEIDGIAKSVSTWVWKNYTGSGHGKRRGICNLDTDSPLEKKQKLGQIESTRNRVNKTLTAIRKAISLIKAKGLSLTKAEVARHAHLDRKTVYRHWASVTQTDSSTVTEEETVSLRDKSATPSGSAVLADRERYPDVHQKGHRRLHPSLQAIVDQCEVPKPPPKHSGRASKTSIQAMRAYIDRLYAERTLRRPI